MSLLGCKDTNKNANTQIFFLIFWAKALRGRRTYWMSDRVLHRDL